MALFLLLSCVKENAVNVLPETEGNQNQTEPDLYYLALGDSYTVGQSVPFSQNFPSQLVERLEADLEVEIALDIVAVTGWRTDELLTALRQGTPNGSYDFATLLIGVNNQFQGRPILQYEDEFETLLTRTINLVGNVPERVVVISIPDYGFTPFAENLDREEISGEIDTYNLRARTIATNHGVLFVNITDISRRGLEEPELVANDGLHLSAEAYSIFVDRIFPRIIARLKD